MRTRTLQRDAVELKSEHSSLDVHRLQSIGARVVINKAPPYVWPENCGFEAPCYDFIVLRFI